MFFVLILSISQSKSVNFNNSQKQQMFEVDEVKEKTCISSMGSYYSASKIFLEFIYSDQFPEPACNHSIHKSTFESEFLKGPNTDLKK